MKIIVRAFNADGYHRDILVMSERQVHMTWGKVGEPNSSCLSGLIGYGGSIAPEDFPEMVKFEIVVQN